MMPTGFFNQERPSNLAEMNKFQRSQSRQRHFWWENQVFPVDFPLNQSLPIHSLCSSADDGKFPRQRCRSTVPCRRSPREWCCRGQDLWKTTVAEVKAAWRVCNAWSVDAWTSRCSEMQWGIWSSFDGPNVPNLHSQGDTSQAHPSRRKLLCPRCFTDFPKPWISSLVHQVVNCDKFGDWETGLAAAFRSWRPSKAFPQRRRPPWKRCRSVDVA